MKNYEKDFELISAYLDNELTGDTKEYIEKLIAGSEIHREKYDELKKIKKLVSEVKAIPESNYFEEALNEKLYPQKKYYINHRKWAPVYGLAVLTIILMIIFRYNKEGIDTILEEQKAGLFEFYTSNLAPLFTGRDLSNDEIFEFAFNKNLPIDENQDQFLVIGYSPTGTEFFEIKNAMHRDELYKYDEFVQKLNLNPKHKLALDSILQSYQPELQSHILINDQNTLALNPNLWNLNKAIVVDVMSYVAEENSDEFESIFPNQKELYTKPELKALIRKIKADPDDEYIFVTPDTIFIHKYTFDHEAFKADMKKMKEDLKKDLDKAKDEIKEVKRRIQFDTSFVRLSKDSTFNKNFRFKFDTAFTRINFGDIVIPEIKLPDFDSIAAHINEATKHLKDIQIEIKSIPHPQHDKMRMRTRISIPQHPDSLVRMKQHDIEINIPNIDSILNATFRSLDTLKFLQNFDFKFDSLGFQFNFSDSLNNFNKEEFKKEMEEMKQELKKLHKKDSIED